MVSPSTQKIFVTLMVILILGFFGYKMLTQKPMAKVNVTALSDTEVVGQDILSLVEKLKMISIDQDFFSSPSFRNLKDFTQPVFPEARGRINPFATIGSDGSSSLDTINQTQATSTGTR